MAEQRDRLRRFRTGGPRPPPRAGRPRGFRGLARAIQEATDGGEELIEFALATFRNPERTHAERWAALDFLAARGHDRPVQHADLEISARPSLPSTWATMTREERLAFINLIE